MTPPVRYESGGVSCPYYLYGVLQTVSAADVYFPHLRVQPSNAQILGTLRESFWQAKEHLFQPRRQFHYEQNMVEFMASCSSQKLAT